jgi:hypothetical protein
MITFDFNGILLQIASGRTNIYPIINKFINDEWEKLRRDQIDPWNFMLSENGFRCKNFYGKQIQYQGVRFEGSPRIVFWGRYIEPFLEDISFRAIDKTIHLCIDKNVILKEPLLETAELLKLLVRKTYNLMADVDRRLRGSGYPDSIGKQDVVGEIAVMDRFIEDRVKSEIAMYKPPAKSIKFYHEHPFLFWSISIFISILSVILGAWGILALY